MHADFTCPNCSKASEVAFSIKDGPPKEVFCPACGQIMERVWKAAIVIPMDFSDDLTTTISQRMSHAARPTGKSKVVY
jgi:transcription elongation factor Elf1